MLIGIPGSGKTTWLKDNSQGYVVVSPDHVRELLFGDVSDQSQNDIVWKTAQYVITCNLLEGRDVILDATNVNTRLRRLFLDKLPECRREAVIFDVDPEMAYGRISKDIFDNLSRAHVPEEVVYRMWGEFQYTKKVLKEDSWDAISNNE
jgi:predicted kinase